MNSTLLLFTIVTCEALFWVFLVLGLSLRYAFHQHRVSGYVLSCIPLIDLLLLFVTVFDLRSGSVATFAHGLAAAYIEDGDKQKE